MHFQYLHTLSNFANIIVAFRCGANEISKCFALSRYTRENLSVTKCLNTLASRCTCNIFFFQQSRTVLNAYMALCRAIWGKPRDFKAVKEELDVIIHTRDATLANWQLFTRVLLVVCVCFSVIPRYRLPQTASSTKEENILGHTVCDIASSRLFAFPYQSSECRSSWINTISYCDAFRSDFKRFHDFPRNFHVRY